MESIFRKTSSQEAISSILGPHFEGDSREILRFISLPVYERDQFADQ